MAINQILVRSNPDAPKFTNYDASVVRGATREVLQLKSIDTSLPNMVGILFEQAVLSRYLLDMNPFNQELLKYNSNIKDSLRTMLHEKWGKSNNSLSLELEVTHQIAPFVLDTVVDYMLDGTIPSSSQVSSIYWTLIADNKYTGTTLNFLDPYFKAASKSTADTEYTNPVLLYPTYRRSEEGDLNITMTYVMYTSSDSKDKPFEGNTTLNYICSLNHVGKSWKNVLDEIQVLQVPSSYQRAGTESLSQVLHGYLRRQEKPFLIDEKKIRSDLVKVLTHIHSRDRIYVGNTKEDVKDLVDLFVYLDDNRLEYLLIEDPTLGQAVLWNGFTDLKEIADMGRNFYTMAAGDDSDDDSSGDTDDDSDDGGDDDNSATDDDISEDDEDDDDLFSDDDDFGDDSDTGDSADDADSGSLDSSDGETNSDDSSEESGSSDTTDAENVNPIIDLIEDETFDEYLDRGVLDTRIRQLISNPPSTMTSTDIQFLEYWYLRWFPCVSVAMTAAILGDMLVSPTKKVKPVED